jgi:hypothetical protein
MADETTTTTSSVEPTTTTTTAPTTSTSTSQDTTTSSTTVTAQASVAPVAEKQGELAVDKEANAVTTNDNDQTEETRIAEAQNLALQNHANEHADDPTPTSGDKTVV